MRGRSWLGCAALTAAILTLTVGACGFDDQLTRRGFIQQGDSLCEQAIGRAFQVRQTTGGGTDPAAQATTIRSLGGGYATIAAGLRKLDVADEDSMMRERMVDRYDRAAAELDSVAGEAAAGDSAAGENALAVIDELLPFALELRNYGFDVCGGREPTS